MFSGAGQTQPALAQPLQNNPPCTMWQQQSFGFARGAEPSVGTAGKREQPPAQHFPRAFQSLRQLLCRVGSWGHLGRNCPSQPRSVTFRGRDEKEALSDYPQGASGFVCSSIPLLQDIPLFLPPAGIKFEDNTELIIKPFDNSCEDLCSFSRGKEYNLVQPNSHESHQ